MITNYIIMRDWETASRDPHKTQPVELAACVIDPKSLQVVEGSCFTSLIRPEFDDEKAIKLGFDPVEDEALKINNITREELEAAPSAKQVWKDYVNYVKKFTKGTGKWGSPHIAGFNSTAFDDIIDARMCELYKPKLDDRKSIPFYHPVAFDLLPIIHCIFNNIKINNQNRVGMDPLREYFGIESDHAHRGLKDVLDCAYIFIKFLKLLRNIESGNINLPLGTRIKYEQSFANENILIKGHMSGQF